MSAKRKVEIFSAGCPACEETIKLVNDNTCSSCDVEILNVNDKSNHQRISDLGVKSIPAIAIDGKLAECCSSRGLDIDKLKDAGLGQV